MLLAVPNISEGRDASVVEDVAAAIGSGDRRLGDVRLLDIHSDPDHHRSVLTAAGAPGALAPAMAAVARRAIELIDLDAPRGAHPHVGAIDVLPFVYLDEGGLGPACAEALLAGDLIGSGLGLPVLLYGALGGGRARADLRRGGRVALAARLSAGELEPDFGPARLHPTAGALLLAARPPLVAFNVELDPPAGLSDARAIAAAIREGGPEGLPGVRAIGLELAARAGVAQVSVNVEDHHAISLAEVVAAVRRHAPVSAAELVGLAPGSALDGFPEDVEMPGFDPDRHLIENALGL